MDIKLSKINDTASSCSEYFGFMIPKILENTQQVTRNGRIVSEKEYRLNIVRKDHQKYVRESLAQAIFHKVLDMERHHQLEIKKRLEDFARRERVQRIKVERARRSDEDIIPLLSPRPPVCPRNCNRSVSRPDVEYSDLSTSPSSPRPSTAPGKLQRPVRLIPLQSNGATPITAQSYTHFQHKEQHLDVPEAINCKYHHGLDRDLFRNWHTLDFPTGMSPYRLPVINNYVTPVPPPPRKREKNGTLRGRRLRPTTAPNGPATLLAKDTPKPHRSFSHSNVLITMVYRGKRLHLSHDQAEVRDEVKVQQQHCGGENLCVYKGKLLETEKFQFVSRRHLGFPFSLTFFLNGIQVNRLSSCCEYKHRRGSRLGGKQAYFAFQNVDGASPCYRCIIAMGLDKKPIPPPKRMKEEVVKEINKEKLELTKDKEKLTVLNASKETSQEETMSADSSVEEEKVKEAEKMHEDEGESSPTTETQGGGSKEEYDDDFEEEEEKTSEEADKKGEGRLQSGEKPSAMPEERWSSDDAKRSQKSDVQDEGSMSEEESSSSSDSESEGGLPRSPASFRSSSYSPRSSEDSDAERPEGDVTDDEEEHKIIVVKDGGDPATARTPGVAPGKATPDSGEVTAVNNEAGEDEKVTEGGVLLEGAEGAEEEIVQAPVREDQSPQGVGGDTEEKAVTDKEIESRVEANDKPEKNNKEVVETGGEALITVDIHDIHSKDVALRGSEVNISATELSVLGRSVAPPMLPASVPLPISECKSVQEKIADAIKEEEHCNSEPEPSDSSTEEEEDEMASGDDMEKALTQNQENEIPAATREAEVTLTDVARSVGVMAERSTHSLSVNPREPAAMLDVEGLTGRCSDPAIVVRKRRGGAMETTESGDPACAPLKEDPVSESSAGPPSAPSIAKAAENKGGLLDWPTSIHLETEEEGNFAEGKDGMLKDENASEGDGTQTKEVGEAEDSRSADQNLATRACTGETPIGRLPANSEVHTQIGDNVEGQDVPDNKKNVSAVSTILSESHPLSLEVSGAGPDMEERAYVGCEVAGNVQSATSLRSPILNIRGRGKVEPAFKQESFVMKDEQEELSQWMHSSNDLATVKEGTAASMTLTGFKLEELTGKMPKYPFIPGLGTGERETTEIDQTTIPETELKNIPDVENETSKRVDSEEQVNDVDMEALGWSATDIGKVQEAQIRKFTEESLSKSQEHQCESMVENYEDPEEASKIGILLPDPLRVNFNPVGNKPMGKGLETGDEEENLSMGLLPIGSYQAINRSKPDLMVSDLKLIPYEVEDSISTVDSLEELIDDLEIEEEFEVEEGTDFKSNSKSSSMEMGRSDGDAQVMELESQVVGLELPVLDVLTNAQTGQTVINLEAAAGTDAEVELEEAGVESQTEEDSAAPASGSENRNVGIMQTGSGGNAAEEELRCLLMEAGGSEGTPGEGEGAPQTEEMGADFVNRSEICSLIDQRESQTASGQQAATRVEMKKDLEALTEGAETPSITEIKQEDEEGVKFQNEESVSGVRSETHPLPQAMGHQELLGGEIMGAENQGTELSSKQESDIEKSAGHLTPAVTALVEAAGGDPKAKRGFSDLESKDCAKNPEAERHREEEPRAEEAVCEPAAEDIETNVLSAEPVAETGVEGVGERAETRRKSGHQPPWWSI
ncbi:glutamate-rich protein 3 [Scyliorhinus torazame]